MSPHGGIFDAERFEALRRTRGVRLGAPLHWRPETGSTNDDALADARAGAAEGTTFVAEHQLRGRGRRGRNWHAEPGAALLFSVVVRPQLPLHRAAWLALAAGACVRDALARMLPALDERALGVKWPNDVWVSGKKIAGVLVESQIEGEELRGAVVGIGVNVAATRFPIELGSTATSLLLEGGVVDRESLLVEVLHELDATLPALSERGFSAIHERIARHDALKGRPIRVDDVLGIASGVDELGRLLVRTSRGDVLPVISGSVELEHARKASEDNE